MGLDSDQTSKMLDDMGKAARAAAEKHNTAFDPPPESEPTRRQRELNDSYGRRFSPWRK